MELFTQTHWGTEHINLSPVFNCLQNTLKNLFKKLWKKALGLSTLLWASKHHLVWTLLWFSSFRSYQCEGHYCTQQTLSALQSVFEDGQQSASSIREWETDSPWRKNKEVITTLASTFTLDSQAIDVEALRSWSYIFKKYMWKSKIWRTERQTARKCWEQKVLSRSTETGVQALWQILPVVPPKGCSKVAKDVFTVCTWLAKRIARREKKNCLWNKLESTDKNQSCRQSSAWQYPRAEGWVRALRYQEDTTYPVTESRSLKTPKIFKEQIFRKWFRCLKILRDFQEYFNT